MSTLLESPAAVHAFEHLIDYAGLFPPAQREMEAALAEYDAAAAGPHAWMLGRFVVPASRLAELRAQRAGGERLELSVILDTGAEARSWFGVAQSALERLAREREQTAWSIAAVDVPLPALQSARDTYDAAIGQCAALLARAGLTGVPAYVELAELAPGDRFDAFIPGAMTALARYGLRAKLRCGGVRPQAYPSVQSIARFIAEATAAGVPFKATAGLHHPVRATRADVTMHGFLNLFCATVFAPHVAPEVVAEIVAEENSAAFTIGADLRWRDLTADAHTVARARRDGFVGYGSCSFDEPIDGLRAMHLLPEA
jgi:hypothetical protein